MLAAPAAAAATRVPVAPVALRDMSAASSVTFKVTLEAADMSRSATGVTLKVPALEARSPRSVIPLGGVSVVAEPTPKKPTTCAPAFVGLIDGAVTEPDDALI